MPRAELALIIEESGQSPVGQPAPEAVRSEGAARSAGVGATTSTASADDASFVRGVLEFRGGVREFIEAVARLSARDGGKVEPARRPDPGPTTVQRPRAEPAGTKPAGDQGVDLGRTFKDLASTLGVAGLITATMRVIRGFAELFTATQVVTAAKVREASISGIRQVRETIDVPFRPAGDADVPRLPAPTTISTRVGPQNAPALPIPRGLGEGGPAEAIKSTLALGRLALGAAAATAGVIALAAAAKAVGDRLDAEARRLSQFSPELAASTARADIIAMRAEIDRARRLGGDLSRFQENWARLEAAVDRLGSRFEQGFLKLANPFVEGAANIVSSVETNAALVEQYANLIIASLNRNEEAAAEAKRELERIRKAAEDAKNRDPLDDEFAEQLLASVGLGLPPTRRRDARIRVRAPDPVDVLGPLGGAAGGIF
jgi:hypothetical protein